MLSAYFDRYVSAYQPYKGGAWCYEDGCIYRGLILLDRVRPNGPWRAHLRRLVDAQVGQDGALAGYRIEEFNIDNILSGRALIALDAMVRDGRYRKAADTLIGQCARQPRTRSGNYWHKQRYPHQVWLDGLYMALPFQIEYGRMTNRAELVGDAVAQMVTALALLADPGTGLFRHGYDEARAQVWADKVSGLSPALWSRAMGWLAMALVDVIAAAGEEISRASGLWDQAARFAEAIGRHQRADGRWNQVTDQPDLAGNYAESSATAMFAYFYLVGARLGIAGCDAAIGLAALDGLEAHGLRGEGGGALALHDICHVAGLGGYSGRYRDGTADYYVSETIVADNSKGVGPLMMATAERWRLAEAERQLAG